jgi:diguanylate cyclase (GGDEF)-like protein
MGYDLRINMSIFNKISSQILLDLDDLEGDYRSSSLSVDKAQSILFLLIAAIGIMGMFAVDHLMFAARPDLFWRTVIYRGGFVLFTLVIIFAIHKTDLVRVFDRLILGWLSVLIVFLLLFNFARPANYLATVSDIITVFAVYVLSPLRFRQNVVLAVCFSIGTVFINYFMKTDVDPVSLRVAIMSQFVVHALGAGAALQLQSYRRSFYKAFVDERDAKEMVAYLANIDPLTKSLTRRQLFSIAESEFLRYVRYHRSLSILVIDADRFKNINDSYGHHAGDIVLRSLSLVALEQKRAQDTFGRLGGEEFGLILPETALEQAKIVAERIQKTWEQSPVNLDGKLIHSTVSIGVAEANPDDKSLEDILRRADRMMYKAKEAGRNCVVTE